MKTAYSKSQVVLDGFEQTFCGNDDQEQELQLEVIVDHRIHVAEGVDLLSSSDNTRSD